MHMPLACHAGLGRAVMFLVLMGIRLNHQHTQHLQIQSLSISLTRTAVGLISGCSIELLMSPTRNAVGPNPEQPKFPGQNRQLAELLVSSGIAAAKCVLNRVCRPHVHAPCTALQLPQVYTAQVSLRS